MTPTQKLSALGYMLPALPLPSGSYAHAVRTGNLLFLAGKGVGVFTGKVGQDVTLDQARQYAVTTTLMLLSVIQKEVGSLDSVSRVIKVNGFINSAPDFSDHPKVMDACSDLLKEIFGEQGVHARTSVGVAATPDQIPLEIEAVIEIK
jgi:enamine deaminase RidA (YjgF/YER057c/UK114 family)